MSSSRDPSTSENMRVNASLASSQRCKACRAARLPSYAHGFEGSALIACVGAIENRQSPMRAKPYLICILQRILPHPQHCSCTASLDKQTRRVRWVERQRSGVLYYSSLVILGLYRDITIVFECRETLLNET